MTAQLTFHGGVETELADAAAWYELRREGLGAAFVAAVSAAFAAIAAMPAAGAPWHEYRKRSVRRFPYLVFYRVVDAESVEITAVAHMHRRPGDWLDR